MLGLLSRRLRTPQGFKQQDISPTSNISYFGSFSSFLPFGSSISPSNQYKNFSFIQRRSYAKVSTSNGVNRQTGKVKPNIPLFGNPNGEVLLKSIINREDDALAKKYRKPKDDQVEEEDERESKQAKQASKARQKVEDASFEAYARELGVPESQVRALNGLSRLENHPQVGRVTIPQMFAFSDKQNERERNIRIQALRRAPHDDEPYVDPMELQDEYLEEAENHPTKRSFYREVPYTTSRAASKYAVEHQLVTEEEFWNDFDEAEGINPEELGQGDVMMGGYDDSQMEYQNAVNKYERKMAKKAKNKKIIMDKRRLREERIAENTKEIYGSEPVIGKGLVGQAEEMSKAHAAVRPKSDFRLSDTDRSRKKTEAPRATEPQESIIGGNMELNLEGNEKKPSSYKKIVQSSPKGPNNGNHSSSDHANILHPGGLSYKELYPEGVLWPSREVNIHMEFPNSPTSKHSKGTPPTFWLKDQLEHDGNESVELVEPEPKKPKKFLKSFTALKSKRQIPSKEERESHQRDEAEESEAESEGKLSIRTRKRMKKEEHWPEWTRASTAVEDLKLKHIITSDTGMGNKPTFKALGIGPSLIETMEHAWTISEPSEIQAISIPPFIHGSNILIADQTGTGKTLAYLLPLLESLYANQQSATAYKRRGQRARAVIILPNRELVRQTEAVLRTLISGDSRFDDFKTYAMSGGLETVKRDTNKLNEGVDILISSPDRFILHSEHQHLHLDDLKILIIDEADTLLSAERSSMATQDVMSRIRSVIANSGKTSKPLHVQFVCATATVSPPLMDFLKKEFGSTMTSVVGGQIHRSAKTLRQDFLFGVHGNFKQRLLFATLKKHPTKKTVIFCNSQQSAKGVNTILQKSGIQSAVVSSDLPPKIRARHFRSFVNDEIPILVSTDLAARGLDMGASVQHVILYDFPTNVIDYLHRIGRTARAGSEGLATSFLGPKDQGLAETIKENIIQGKSLASIRPSKPDDKLIHQFEKQRRRPKPIRRVMDSDWDEAPRRSLDDLEDEGRTEEDLFGEEVNHDRELSEIREAEERF